MEVKAKAEWVHWLAIVHGEQEVTKNHTGSITPLNSLYTPGLPVARPGHGLGRV